MIDKLLQKVDIVGIGSAVPSQVVYNKENRDFTAGEVEKIVASTGVIARRVVSAKLCTSDLCYAAAENLLNELACDRNEIDIVLFISQTPDYILPATACVLQHKLNLKKEIIAFDINLGCSGYTYGLIVLANLLSSGLYKKALLLAGDTISKVVSPQDRSVAFLFGDAGSATLLEYNPKALSMYFDFGTDGVGFDKLQIEAGGYRTPFHTNLMEKKLCEGDNYRAKTDLYMSGADIFNFTLREVPRTIDACLQTAKLAKADIDLFFLHQANLFMLNHLVKKMGLEGDKVPMTLQNYGNTSVASIPLTMSQEWQTFAQSKKILLCGFGVGFSWATIILETKNLKIFAPVIVEDQ